MRKTSESKNSKVKDSNKAKKSNAYRMSNAYEDSAKFIYRGSEFEVKVQRPSLAEKDTNFLTFEMVSGHIRDFLGTLFWSEKSRIPDVHLFNIPLHILCEKFHNFQITKGEMIFKYTNYGKTVKNVFDERHRLDYFCIIYWNDALKETAFPVDPFGDEQSDLASGDVVGRTINELIEGYTDGTCCIYYIKRPGMQKVDDTEPVDPIKTYVNANHLDREGFIVWDNDQEYADFFFKHFSSPSDNHMILGGDGEVDESSGGFYTEYLFGSVINQGEENPGDRECVKLKINSPVMNSLEVNESYDDVWEHVSEEIKAKYKQQGKLIQVSAEESNQ